MPSIAIAVAILAFCATQSSGHMIMSTPVPYGKSSLDSSPLSSGTNYPCKQRSGVYNDEGARAKNTMAIGATQQLSFSGSASHGGGSVGSPIFNSLTSRKHADSGIIVPDKPYLR